MIAHKHKSGQSCNDVTSELFDNKEESSLEKWHTSHNASVFIHYVMCIFYPEAVIFCVVQRKR